MESHNNNMFCMFEWIEDPVSGLLLSDIITSQETGVGQNIRTTHHKQFLERRNDNELYGFKFKQILNILINKYIMCVNVSKCWENRNCCSVTTLFHLKLNCNDI